MTHNPSAQRRQVEITNALGLHLRPAAKFVKTADQFQAEIRIWYKGHDYDGRSILDLAGLAAERGSRLEIEATGPDAEIALSALADLVLAEFHEDENGDPKKETKGVPNPASTSAAPVDPQGAPAPDLNGAPSGPLPAEESPTHEEPGP